MIKIKSVRDLRIGNYVRCKVSNDTGIYRVVALDGIHLKVMLDGVRQGSWYSDDWDGKGKIKGIKITEKWLLNLGFTHINSALYVHPQFKSIELFFFPDILVIGNLGKENMRIKYVHELQNKFHAFTEFELTL